jgi:hypothetical protein
VPVTQRTQVKRATETHRYERLLQNLFEIERHFTFPRRERTLKQNDNFEGKFKINLKTHQVT